MRPSFPSSNALKAVLAAVLPSALLMLTVGDSAGQTVLPLGPFRSVTLRNGGEVILRHAPSQRVTVLKGAVDCTSAAIVDGDRLVIDRRHGECQGGHEVSVEILTPDVDHIIVTDGGTVETRGSFPRQGELRVTVQDGGTVDLRAMNVDEVTAAVRDGGRILTRPRETLVANIARGGVVMYWGHPYVTSRVNDGGVVWKGSAADADKTLRELGPEVTAPPLVPPVPPVAPMAPPRSRGTF